MAAYVGGAAAFALAWWILSASFEGVKEARESRAIGAAVVARQGRLS
jgi:hypothetical protein